MINFVKCERCGQMVPAGSLRWTRDIQGNWLRRVCRGCLIEVRAEGYDKIEDEEKEVAKDDG